MHFFLHIHKERKKKKIVKKTKIVGDQNNMIFDEVLKNVFHTTVNSKTQTETYALFFFPKHFYLGLPRQHPWVYKSIEETAVVWSSTYLPDGYTQKNMWFLRYNYVIDSSINLSETIRRSVYQNFCSYSQEQQQFILFARFKLEKAIQERNSECEENAFFALMQSNVEKANTEATTFWNQVIVKSQNMMPRIVLEQKITKQQQEDDNHALSIPASTHLMQLNRELQVTQQNAQDALWALEKHSQMLASIWKKRAECETIIQSQAQKKAKM